MEDNNRINRRSRNRPYDLRRKVLLKNFLREQMNHIPETRIESASQNNSANFAEESSVTVHSGDLPVLDEDTSSTATGSTQNSANSSDNNNSEHIRTDSNVDVLNTDNSVADINSAGDSSSESSFFTFAGLVKFKRESKKSRKGIFKAKEVCKNIKSPIKTRSFKSGLERVFYGRKRPSESSSTSQMSKNSPRSLFSLFKYRREQRHVKGIDRIKRSPPCANFISSGVPAKYSTINQSVQTDDSWARGELVKVQQSNRRLKEENRLLTESLSYFMSNASMDPQIRHSSSPLQSSNKNANSMAFPDYYIPSSNTSSDSWNSRTRVLRSKSVHEQRARRNFFQTIDHGRSMSFHNSRNNIATGVKPSVSTFGAQTETINIPRVRRKNMLTNIPSSNSGRNIQRRSSMPERTLSENDRSVICRRSGSVRDTRSRKPFYTLPSEAFY